MAELFVAPPILWHHGRLMAPLALDGTSCTVPERQLSNTTIYDDHYQKLNLFLTPPYHSDVSRLLYKDNMMEIKFTLKHFLVLPRIMLV